MIRYDLKDIGYNLAGPASFKTYELDILGWKIINIPADVSREFAEKIISKFLNRIVAVEVPTSLMCNLRCKYCYITDPRIKNIKYRHTVLEELCKAIQEGLPRFRKPDEKNPIHLSSWGAEPFADLEALKLYFGYFIDRGYAVKVNCSTNGTFATEPVFKYLDYLFTKGYLHDLQVSLDGPPEIQNRNRPLYSGGESFPLVERFIDFLVDISKRLKRRVFHFCSTINLNDDTFVNDWLTCLEFFLGDPISKFFVPVAPMRMSGEDLTIEENVEKFVEAIHKGTQLILEMVQGDGTGRLDFYAMKLFGKPVNKSKNAFPHCSALHTQIGIDLDGSIYPCHGPITTPLYKPWLWIGNIFEKVISFRSLYSNISYQYCTVFKGKCATCPIYLYGNGSSICWNCAPHNLAMSNNPGVDANLKCVALLKSFKSWLMQARASMSGSVLLAYLDNIDDDYWLNAFPEVEAIHKIDVSWKHHFDPTYQGEVVKVQDFLGIKPANSFYETEWWNKDNFLEIANKEKKRGSVDR